MKKFRIVFSGFFLLFLIICARAIFSQYDSKTSILNNIFNEQSSIQVAYSALAPASIFPTVTGNIIQPGVDRIEQAFIQKRSLNEIKLNQTFNQKIKSEDEFSSKKPADRKIALLGKHKELKTESPFKQKSNILQATQKAAESQLIQHEDLQGTINTLPYERIKNIGVRFRYTSIPEEIIGHFWRFKSADLRGKTIRIYYSGIVPNEIIFLMSRSYSSVKASYRVPLTDSSQTQVISLKVPNSIAFKDISILEFQIEKFRARKPYGDFLIEKIDVVANENVSSNKIENSSRPFSFGDPYLQSNIWGGEVLAS